MQTSRIAAVILLIAISAPAQSGPAPASSDDHHRVLIELFTSQR